MKISLRNNVLIPITIVLIVVIALISIIMISVIPDAKQVAAPNTRDAAIDAARVTEGAPSFSDDVPSENAPSPMYASHVADADVSDSTRVPVGLTQLLKNDEGSPQAFVQWDGLMEATVNSARVYESIEQALVSEDVGNVFAPTTGIENPALVVVRITIHNIDASNSHDGTHVYSISQFALQYQLPGGNGWAVGSLASFSGTTSGNDATSPSSGSRFELLPGQIRDYVYSYWVPRNSLSSLCIMPSLSDSYHPFVFDLGLSDVDAATD